MNGVIHQSGGSMEHDTWEFETDNSLLHPKGNILPKWKINHGFDNDDAGSNKHRKQTEGGNLSSGRTDLISGYDHRSSRNTSLSSKSLDRFTERSATSDIDRKNVGYYGDMKYFVDDNDETETLTVNSDDNWLLRNPNQELDVIVGPKYNKDYENSTHSLGPIAQSDNSTGKNNNQMGKSYREETAYSTGSIHEKNTKNSKLPIDIEEDYDDVAVIADPGLATEEVHDEDINDALEGFDYLDEMDENHDEGVKEALSSFNYLDDPDEIHGDVVKDALGKFDYLDDIEEQKGRKSSETSQSVRNEKPSTRPHSGAHIHKEKCRDNEKRIPVINMRENVPKRNVEDVPKLRDDRHEVTNNFNKRIFDEDSLEFNNHRSYPLPEAYLDNRANRPNQFDKNEHEFKAYPPNVRDIRNAKAHILPKVHRNNVPNKLDERKTALLFDRTKSEEMVSGFPVGEFILRRTQSEELKHPPTRQKIKPKFEPVPEDRQVDFTEPMKIDYSKKRDQRFDDLGACSVILKVFLILLFGLAATKITLGVLFWNSCEVDNIIPVCVIASGGVSLFYCVSLFGIDFMRKRFKKTSRALRAVLLFLWVMLLGFIIAGCVLLYPKIKDYAFKDCDSETDCCKRKFILTAFCAIITDIICQFSFGAILCCMK